MARSNQVSLDDLARHSSPSSVSIWMPTHKGGRETEEDPIRMKNLLSRAKKQLVGLNYRAPDAEQLLGPLQQIAEDADFWRHQSLGLGAFLGNGKAHVLKVPVSAPELVVVGEHFHVKPLFGPAYQNRRFYLLELSENVVRLFRATRFDMEPVDLPDAPGSFAEFLRFDEFERHVEFHTGSASHQPGGDRPAVYHGQGGRPDEAQEKRRLAEYCRKIDAEIGKRLTNDRSPLLLAATEPLRGIYRQVSSLRNLDDRAVTGNPDIAGQEDLHRQAVDLLQQDFSRPVEQALARCRQARNSGLSCDDLEGILRAASLKAVELLLIAEGEDRWGSFDAKEGRLEQHPEQRPGDEDLLNLAAILAHKNGATVHAVEREKLPDCPAFATLRFQPDA